MEIDLTLAERHGLELLRDRIAQGVGPMRGRRMGRVLPLRTTPNGPIDAVVGPPDGVTVRLERQFADQWSNECTCRAGTNCGHVLAVLGFLVGEPRRVSKRAKGGDDDGKLQRVVEAALGRPLTPDELAYLAKVLDGFLRARAKRGLTLEDSVRLADPPPGRDWVNYHRAQAFTGWPAEPLTALQYWHAVAYQLDRQGLRTPGFMAAVTAVHPPPEAWKAHWRQERLDAWKGKLTHALRAQTARRDAKPGARELRLVLGAGIARIEIRSASSPNWVPLTQTELHRAVDAHLSLTWVGGAAVELLWATLLRAKRLDWGLDPKELLAPAGARLLLAVLERPTLHPTVVTPDGEPYLFPSEPLRWRLIEAEGGEDRGYRFEVTRADLTPAPPALIRVDGAPGFWVAKREVYRLPPPNPLINQSVNEPIPAEVLENEAGVSYLGGLDAVLPERLERSIVRIPLELVLELTLGAGKGPVTPQDVLSIRVSEALPEALGMPKGKGATSDAGTRIILPDRKGLPDAASVLQGLDAKPDPENDRYLRRMTRGFPDKFLEWFEALPPRVRVRMPPELRSIVDPPVEVEVELTVKPAGVDWFDLTVTVRSQDTTLTQEELNLLIGAKGGFVPMGSRGWMRARINLPEEDRANLAGMGLDPGDLSPEPQRLHTLQLAQESTRRLLPPDQAEQIQRRVAEFKTRVTPPVPPSVQATLRPYQIEGFHFLAYLSENRFGGVLADDMGLGKTLQSLAWIAWLREQAGKPVSGTADGRRILIVCPKSVAPNWTAEAGRFLPDLRIGAWAGSCERPVAEVLGGLDALVVNYAQLRLLEDQLVAQDWLAVILDEAQAIKNPDSQTGQTARALKARFRLGLTGTPIENRLLDLWSIFSFAMPGVLGTRAQFQKSFGKTADALARRRLAGRVRPFLLRRTKSEVARDLPDRIEEDVICELEGVQRDLYQAEYKKARALLLGVKTQAELNEMRFHFLTSLLRLRQICCHPALVDERQLGKPSAKVEALGDLLEPLMEEGNKVLVFSQFTTMLDLLQSEIRKRGWKEFMLTGKSEDRGALVEAFTNCTEPAVFLISLKAGGFGLNLTAASYVVLFDPWWNPAVEAQAIDRTHRIGQTSTVIAYRLLVKGSIEEKIRQLQKTKSALAQDILGEEQFSQALTLDDLKFLFDTAEAAV